MNLKNVINENPLLAILRNVPDDKLINYAEAIVDEGVNFFEFALKKERDN